MLVLNFNHADVKVFDNDDELIFIATRTSQSSWAGYIAIVVFIGLAAIFWIQERVIISLLLLVGGGFALAANWAQGNMTRLRVTRHQINASGNLQRTFTTDVFIETAKVTSIGYSTGGEDTPSGLHVWQGWSTTCVLPDITRKQAEYIRDSIARKFPEIAVYDRSPASLLYGNSSGVTVLGLGETNSDVNP